MIKSNSSAWLGKRARRSYVTGGIRFWASAGASALGYQTSPGCRYSLAPRLYLPDPLRPGSTHHAHHLAYLAPDATSDLAGQLPDAASALADLAFLPRVAAAPAPCAPPARPAPPDHA